MKTDDQICCKSGGGHPGIDVGGRAAHVQCRQKTSDPYTLCKGKNGTKKEKN